MRALAGLIRRPPTPGRRLSSSTGSSYPTGPGPTKLITPIHELRTMSRIRRPLHPVGQSGSNPPTPHTIRALRQRRATPGQDRRKSGRTQRETPRDALRILSKLLAKTSQPSQSSPNSAQSGSGIPKQQDGDEFEDELSPELPKFTIAVENEEDGSSFMDRPSLSIPLDEGEQTAKSIEIPRRAFMEDESGGRLSKDSLAGIQANEKFGILGDLEVDDARSDFDQVHHWQDVTDEIEDLTRSRDSG